MNNHELKEKMTRFLQTQKADELKLLVDSLHPSVTAEVLQGYSPAEGRRILEIMEARKRADLFAFLELEYQVEIAQAMEDPQLVELVNYLSHDERVDLLSQLDEDRKEILLKQLAKAEREDIRKLESYDEGTIGAIMTSDYVALKSGMTVSQAIDALRSSAPDAETIYYAYVLDEDRQLIGVVSLKQLITARASQEIEGFMKRSVISVHTRGPVEEAVRVMGKSDLLALPVLDRNQRMVGIVTYDDLADVAEDASTEDFHRMAAAPGLKALSLRGATVGQLIAKRLPWLLVLVFMNIFSGAGIAFFEDTIEAVVALVFFLPLLIDSGGNAGSQAATLMVRALAIGDVRLRDWFYFLRKEIGISLIMGVAMGVAVAAIASFRAPEVVPVVAMTMACTVVMGSLIGMMLPFILTKLKVDPATASAPLITSLADIAGVLIYFGIATWWLGIGS